jgi:glycosyltransferase involved in cell wall biosynthesis
LNFADVSVVVPVFNEEENIGGVVDRIRATVGEEAEVIVVDDGSTDRTPEILATKNARVIRNPYNKGNGATVKTGLRAASRSIVVLMDGDGQHRPEDIPVLLEKVGDFDMAIGSRTAGSARSAHRTLYNSALNHFAGYLTGRRIPDLTSGFRAIKREIAKKFIYLLPNTFSYPSTITLAMIKAGHNVCFVPLVFDARKGKSKIRLFEDGLRFLMIILRISTLYAPLKVFLPVSILFFTTGIGWYIYTFLMWHRFTNLALFMLSTSVILFMLGLIAEQISQLRFERTED